MSLSKYREDASQWERFGDDCKGICIEFDAQKLYEFMWSHRYRQSINNLVEVLYIPQNNPVGWFVEKEPKLKDGIKAILSGVQTEPGLDSLEKWADNLCTKGIAIKSASYQNEGEYRLYIHTFPDFTGEIGVFKNKRGENTQYIDISFSENLDLVKGIHIGSDCVAADADIEKMLRDNGLFPTVSRSTCNY